MEDSSQEDDDIEDEDAPSMEESVPVSAHTSPPLRVSGRTSEQRPVRKKKPGIIYLSSIPPGFNVTRTTEFFSAMGKIGRVFLQPDKNKRHHARDHVALRLLKVGSSSCRSVAKDVAENVNCTQLPTTKDENRDCPGKKESDFFKRKVENVHKRKYNKNERHHAKDHVALRFTEGWIEFMSKRVAKDVAENVNCTPVGGKKRSQSHEVLWNIKYLPRFKWSHLTERLNYEKATHHQKMRTEIARAKKESDFFKRKVEMSTKRKYSKRPKLAASNDDNFLPYET
ncbi:hypothetical protein TCAL_10596 [Tigriopus californicus]|uniref:Activator of basal transcription 1 n=1 Tax=Tigriopus californicus TaxID=6832 RepID=A0A553P338_TIGCA|nr:hypothetical protein TCAL_10596 [Tigriopus californicus]